MPIDLNALPNNSNVLAALDEGEGRQLEFKSSITSVLDLGKLVSSFANASGGWIIVGVAEKPLRIVGCDWQQLSNLFDRVNERLRPAQNVTLHQVNIGDSKVGVVVVKPTSDLVVTDAGAFVRKGELSEPMPQEQVLARMNQRPQADRESQSAGEIARLTQTVDELMAKFDESQTWRGQKKNLVIGALGSTLSTIIVALVVLLVGIILGYFFKG